MDNLTGRLWGQSKPHIPMEDNSCTSGWQSVAQVLLPSPENLNSVTIIYNSEDEPDLSTDVFWGEFQEYRCREHANRRRGQEDLPARWRTEDNN